MMCFILVGSIGEKKCFALVAIKKKIQIKNNNNNNEILSVYTLANPCPSPEGMRLQLCRIRWLAAGHRGAQYSNPGIKSEKEKLCQGNLHQTYPCNLRSEAPSMLLLNSCRVTGLQNKSALPIVKHPRAYIGNIHCLLK